MSTERTLIVSSDLQVGPQLLAELVSAGLSGCELIDSGESFLSLIDSTPAGTTITAVVDAMLTDISPLNLVGGVSSRRPDAGIVLVVSPADQRVVDRAMLAGARAVVDRACLESDLVPAVRKVSVGAARRAPATSQSQPKEAARGRSLVIAGAKGGAGRSTIAALVGIAAARRGIKTAVVDFDLQFGDLGFIFDSAVECTLLDLVNETGDGSERISDFANVTSDGLSLFLPSPLPEHAEVVAPRIASLLRRMQSEYALVIVNTGAFWTLLHAELLDAADLTLMVMNQQASGVRATVLAKGLCHRLGIPDAKLAFVMNRFNARGAVTSHDAAAALQITDLLVLPDGGPEVSAFLDAGNPTGLADSRNPLPSAVSQMLDALAKRMSLPLVAVEEAPARKTFGWR